jgi:diadenosine tetraphosphate (Ap4A) HIT family hydrolase
MSALDCYACDLMTGKEKLLGGRIHETRSWVVEHCMGPLGVGTLIVKPRRHLLHAWELNSQELSEMGPLLGSAATVVRNITGCDQVYICLWSHGGFSPVHIHFVIQPVSNQMGSDYENAGPSLQAEMFRRSKPLEPKQVQVFCDGARAAFAAL